MSPTNPPQSPALSRIPPLVQSKLSSRAIETIEKVWKFVEEDCIPAEPIMEAQLTGDKRWTNPPLMKELRQKAKSLGLFNLFLPKTFKESPGFTNLEYACMAEIMGRCYWSAECMNCNAPDTGNIELLAKYCNPAQKEKWLKPLLEGECGSAYSMTEPDVASSDATNIACSMRKEGNEYVINGRKLYGNTNYNKDMRFYILMACSDPTNPDAWKRHSMIIVPRDTPGLKMVRHLTILGYDHAPHGHGEYVYENARIPAENLILGEGRAFEIAQGRLGPGRIHHCMRLIGATERAYELALARCIDPQKKPRGKLIGQFDSNIERIGQMRMEIDSLKLVVYNAADIMDVRGNKAGRYAIAQSKVLVPIAAARIIDECMQLYGGQGLTQHTMMPEAYTYARFVRIADGPDSAHRHQVGRDELKTAQTMRERNQAYTAKHKDLAKKWGVTIHE